MDSKGKLFSVTKDILSRKLIVAFQIETEPIDELNNLQGMDLSIKVSKYRQKRSLDANAYFHVLVGKLADVLGISKSECKNSLICSYGQQDFLEDGQPVVIKSNIPIKTMMNQELLHCLPCGADKNNADVTFYKVFRGSHTYNTKEMSILINGTVEECKLQGIETLPPAELERLLSKWQRA